jgi:hypothetical protein
MKMCRQATIGALALLFCATAVGCHCISRQTSQYYERANVVVMGKVISTNEADLLKEGKKYVRRVSVRVQETYKGDSDGTLNVEDSYISCSLSMQEGDRVILFLDKNLVSDKCNGSAVLYADEVLRTRFKMDEQSIRTYQLLLQTLVVELRSFRPKEWWQVWR